MTKQNDNPNSRIWTWRNEPDKNERIADYYCLASYTVGSMPGHSSSAENPIIVKDRPYHLMIKCQQKIFNQDVDFAINGQAQLVIEGIEFTFILSTEHFCGPVFYLGVDTDNDSRDYCLKYDNYNENCHNGVYEITHDITSAIKKAINKEIRKEKRRIVNAQKKKFNDILRSAGWSKTMYFSIPIESSLNVDGVRLANTKDGAIAFTGPDSRLFEVKLVGLPKEITMKKKSK